MGTAGADLDALRATIHDYFSALHECDASAFHRMWHPRGVLLGLSPSGAVVARSADEFCAGVVARGKSPEYAKHDAILSVESLDPSCASAKVCIALPPAPDSPTPTTTPVLYTDFLTLLKDPALGWRVIAKVYSSKPLTAPSLEGVPPILPGEFGAAAGACWDGYVAAGRACDADAMSKVFHPACSLTFVGDEGVVVVSSEAFCERVSGRWGMESHKPYAHLRDDPRVASCDSLVSLDFAGPSVCRAMLRIGYPPFLYSDVLLLLKLSSECRGRDGGWWIVAKSSVNVPFLADEARP